MLLMGAKSADRIAELEAENKRLHRSLNDCEQRRRKWQEKAEQALYDGVDGLEGLLRIAKCPDAGCDGKGTVCRGEYQHENGEIEFDLSQCQWCDEREQALKAKT